MRGGAEDGLASGSAMHAYTSPMHGIQWRWHSSMISPVWPRTQANAMDAHMPLKLKKKQQISRYPSPASDDSGASGPSSW
jgi:hypothetical protein